MPIRVTCRGCHTRFNVSDKFAGREGPCPKCKAIIRIPDKSQEVVIHAPPDAGPKDQKGVSISKPIFRRELVFTPVLWTTILGVIATLFVLALLLRGQQYAPDRFPLWILAVGAILVAVPTVYGGYGMLRDSELAGFAGRELWIRILICAAMYAALWLIMPLTSYAVHGYDTMSWSIAMAVMVALGGAVAMSVLDLEFLVGVMHYGMYLGCTLILRWVAGAGVFPGQLKATLEETSQAVGSALIELIGRMS